MIPGQTNLQNDAGKPLFLPLGSHTHQITHLHAVSHAVIPKEIKKVSAIIPAIINSSLILIPII
tara:strand:- start:209 stop:400 length:192 start_codon:yes stop_codon:yes gene_type:complete